ncbi:MAG: hypothetical protein SAJ12_11940 [Jaaginema sp. PMC 1079.18]|nr:hypothetical protein [Jaaginema sp. PMC 1080.18]MEC4851717.1 hypothetical protein [Jaaginema sp. PMC 1079.18]MEC4868456.1 hypothetical protein [Jaaginema sp. PMC 1078.18]
MSVTQERLSCRQMPLAVYREVAAHLRQVEGVRVDLIPQTARQFSYDHSQIEGLLLSCPEDGQAQIRAILAYYEQRHGAWQRESSAATRLGT